MKNEKIKLDGRTYRINEVIDRVPEVNEVITIHYVDEVKVIGIEKVMSVSEADGNASIFPEAFNYDYYIITVKYVEDEDEDKNEEFEVVCAVEKT